MRIGRLWTGLAGLGGVALLSVAAAGPGHAQHNGYAWCAHYVLGHDAGENCYFYTYEQCQAAASGTGGICMRNQLYAPARNAAPPRQDKRSRR